MGYYTNWTDDIDLLLFNAYTRVSPQLTRLYLNSGNAFKSIPLPYLYHLKLAQCSLVKLETIFRNTPQLQSLDIRLKLETPKTDISLASSRLTQLKLKIVGEYPYM